MSQRPVLPASCMKLLELRFVSDKGQAASSKEPDAGGSIADDACKCESGGSSGELGADEDAEGFRLENLECPLQLILSAAVCHFCRGELCVSKNT